MTDLLNARELEIYEAMLECGAPEPAYSEPPTLVWELASLHGLVSATVEVSDECLIILNGATEHGVIAETHRMRGTGTQIAEFIAGRV